MHDCRTLFLWLSIRYTFINLLYLVKSRSTLLKCQKVAVIVGRFNCAGHFVFFLLAFEVPSKHCCQVLFNTYLKATSSDRGYMYRRYIP